ncbi:MAG: BspA family leucine-rich repeat surface protein, partial [Coriobacteriales bacterium]|nr:BspA family leucine-rich repeat surface protein [Coriobacteriales bacterium]
MARKKLVLNTWTISMLLVLLTVLGFPTDSAWARETQSETLVERSADQGVDTVSTSETVDSGTWGTCPWELDADGVLTVYAGKGANQRRDNGSYPDSPWMDAGGDELGKELIKEIVFEQGTILPESCLNLFYGLSSLEGVDASRCNTSSVTDMRSMFSGCSSLASLDLSTWDTSSVTDMSFMFYDCSSLASLDVASWNTVSVTSARFMFACPSLSVLDVSSWDVSSIADMGYMF